MNKNGSSNQTFPDHDLVMIIRSACVVDSLTAESTDPPYYAQLLSVE